MKNNKKYIKRELIIPLNSGQLVTESLLTEVINKLFANEIKDIFSIKGDSGYIASFFAMQRGNGSFISIGPMVALLPSTDAQGYINYIVNYFINKDNTYLDSNYLSINIKLVHREGEAPISKQVESGIKNKDSDLTIFNHYRIPGFINPYDMGNVIDTVVSGDITIYFISIDGGIIIIAEQTINADGFIHSNIKLIRGGSVVIKAKDVQTSPDRFTRSIQVGDITKVWIYDMKGNKILKYNDISTKFMESSAPDTIMGDKIIAYDIETTQAKVGDKLILEPYLACYGVYHNKLKIINGSYFYITDYKNSGDMIKASLTSLFRRKYHGYTVYVHNLSNFDSNFILKYLAVAFGKTPIKLIYKDGRVISIKVFYGGKYTYCITFVDSYQLLPSSLEKLAVAFELSIQKTPFPHGFLDGDPKKFNYVGNPPAMEYFAEGTFANIEEYNKYYNTYELTNLKGNKAYDGLKTFVLKKEAIDYCLNDCGLLLNVILAFNSLIFDKFKVDVTKSPTLSSLSFKIFRKNFFDKCKNLIPIFKYSDDLNIRKSYFGGTVGMIKPTNVFNKAKLWLLDFNSLYPYIMATFEMPCGKVRHFVGNILEKESKPIGFFKANIIAPDNLKVPVLTTKVLVDGKLTNVAPTGTFTDWYFSEELFNARDRFGYKFEVLEGYVFSERKVLFSEYMSTLYKLRTSFDKDNPLNMVAKLLLNSFYGRWGMVPYFSNTKILSDSEMDKLLSRGNINNLDSFIDFNNGHHLAIFNPDLDKLLKDNPHNYSNVSIGIASAITAYGRIIMSQFKNHPQFDLYYFDTDSIVIDINPDKLVSIFPNIIGSGMGQLKVEYIIDKAVFLAPKTYFLELENGDKVIKVKGLSQKQLDLSLDDFIDLLYKESSLNLKQEVWSKNKSEANIAILEQTYTLTHNINKRINIYDTNGILKDTSPIEINNAPEDIVNFRNK